MGFCRSTVSMNPLSDCGKSVIFSAAPHRPERRMSRPPTDETSGGSSVWTLSVARNCNGEGPSGAVEEMAAFAFEQNKRGKRVMVSCSRSVGSWGRLWSCKLMRSGQGDTACSLRRSKAGECPLSGESSRLETLRSGLGISISKLGVWSTLGSRPVAGREDSEPPDPTSASAKVHVCMCMCTCVQHVCACNALSRVVGKGHREAVVRTLRRDQ